VDRNFDATLARVLGFVDLPSDPACARFYEADSPVRTVSRSQVRQPVNARGLGRWKAYGVHLKPLIDELERAGALDDWRERPLTAVGAKNDSGDARPYSSAERLPQ
jgi:hypothetical protein